MRKVLNRFLAAKNPPCRANHQNEADKKHGNHNARAPHDEPCAGLVSSKMLALGQVPLHWATTSRALLSHRPHWVATPSSNWMSSKPIPARAWRAISRSEIRRQTQMIMVGLGSRLYQSEGFIINENGYHLQLTVVFVRNKLRLASLAQMVRMRQQKRPCVMPAKVGIQTRLRISGLVAGFPPSRE